MSKFPVLMLGAVLSSMPFHDAMAQSAPMGHGGKMKVVLQVSDDDPKK